MFGARRALGASSPVVKARLISQHEPSSENSLNFNGKHAAGAVCTVTRSHLRFGFIIYLNNFKEIRARETRKQAS